MDDGSFQKKFRSPLVNGILAALVILLGGFMTYNFVGKQLTQLAGVSSEKIVTPTPSIEPTMTPEPTPSFSPAPSY